MNDRITRLLGGRMSERVLRICSLLVFLALWLAAGVRYDGDSASYIEGTVLRSPLYPLVIDIFGFLDGSLRLLVLFQLLLGLVAIHLFLQALRRVFDIDAIVSAVILIFISIPYFFITPGQKFFMGNLVMTGAVCYPLFLMACASVIHAVMRPQLRYYIYFIILTALLILTRRQFLFLYPFFMILWLALFIQKGRIGFSRPLLLAVFILSAAGTNLIERSYQYVRHDRFSTIPFTGRQLLVMPMFIASDADGDLFGSDVQRGIFDSIRGEMRSEGMNLLRAGSPMVNVYSDFERHYDHISHHIIPGAARKVMGDGFDEYRMDGCTVEMSLVLIRHNIKSYLTLYLKNIEMNSGEKPFIFLLMLVFVVALARYVETRSKTLLILLLALVMQLGNYMLVGLVEPIIWRYTIYTNQVLFTILALCAASRIREEHGGTSRPMDL